MYPLASALRSLRLTKKLSVREVAAKARISAAYLSDLERAKRPGASPKVLDSIARVLMVEKSVLRRLDKKQRIALAMSAVSDLERELA
jgi:transcriptional regulator with XRE-family HTH domain